MWWRSRRDRKTEWFMPYEETQNWRHDGDYRWERRFRSYWYGQYILSLTSRVRGVVYSSLELMRMQTLSPKHAVWQLITLSWLWATTEAQDEGRFTSWIELHRRTTVCDTPEAMLMSVVLATVPDCYETWDPCGCKQWVPPADDLVISSGFAALEVMLI